MDESCKVGILMTSKSEVTDMREVFEKWYTDRYSPRRGAYGRASHHLTQYEGEYVSDHARECYTVWQAALESVK